MRAAQHHEHFVPLAVDIDGTLIRGDLLFESLLRLLRHRPWQLFLLPLWAWRGRAYLKRQLAAAVPMDMRWLPYRASLIAWLREQRAAGRRLVLASAADERLARGVAAELGLFDEVIASSPGRNLKGRRKRDALMQRFGERGFDYAGDALADLPVWRAARRAIVVQPGARLRWYLAHGGIGATPIERVFDAGLPGPGAGLKAGIKTWAKALRVHQWVKNILVFLPLLAGQALGDADALGHALLAFVALSLCASGTYLLNDLLDLEADRQHPSKQRRPFASGALGLLPGLLAFPLLMGAGLLLGALLPGHTGALIALYVASTTLYSLWLKRKMLVDVFMLAMLYTLRVLIGGEASGLQTSAWLLAFSIFTFLSLGAAKRGAELLRFERSGREAANGRDYFVWDRHAVAMLGLGAAFGSALVLALYLQSEHVRALYAQPSWLWLLVPLVLYWLARAWMVTLRGAMHDDPIVFAATDRLTWMLMAVSAGILMVAKWSSSGLPGVTL